MLEVLINPCAGGQVRRAKEAVERLCKMCIRDSQ